jgi:hypothetical protein
MGKMNINRWIWPVPLNLEVPNPHLSYEVSYISYIVDFIPVVPHKAVAEVSKIGNL